MKVPKLRFKEFSGEWGEKKLIELSKKISDGLHSTPIYSEDGEYFFINGNNIKNNKILISNTTKKIDKKEYDKYKLELDSNTLLISLNGTIGNLGYYNYEKIILGKSCGYIKLKENVNKYFLLNLLENTKIQTYFFQELTGTVIKNLSLQTLKNTNIAFPSLEEQEKIGNFLSSIDKKISLTEEKLNLFKSYKKGMMQKIFKQEIRFKDENGQDYPDWVEKRLGDIAKIVMGQSPSSSNYNEEFKGLPLIQGNADCNNRKIFPRMYTTEITKESFPNDIIMTVRAPVGAVSLSEIHSCIGRGVCAIRNANKYIYHYLIKLEDSWDKIAQGSTFTAINSNDIKNLIINLPCLEEQEKIAEFLSSIDNKIENLSNNLENLKEFKKGLLQKMFI